jgi:hypothetical protein
MLIDNLDNIVVAGDTDQDDNFIASFTESGTINFSMLFNNGSYGYQVYDLISASDNGIVALCNGDDYGCIQGYQIHCLHCQAYILKIDPTGAGCGGYTPFSLELYGTGVRTQGNVPITDPDWAPTALPIPQRRPFNVTVKFGCSLGTFSVVI